MPSIGILDRLESGEVRFFWTVGPGSEIQRRGVDVLKGAHNGGRPPGMVRHGQYGRAGHRSEGGPRGLPAGGRRYHHQQQFLDEPHADGTHRPGRQVGSVRDSRG